MPLPMGYIHPAQPLGWRSPRQFTTGAYAPCASSTPINSCSRCMRARCAPAWVPPFARDCAWGTCTA